MTATANYELVLMLDPEAPDERRDQIAAEARNRIESEGTLKADAAWGMRKLAYEIRQRTEADYRFFRFETASPLLSELDHTLKITDGVLRFRIFKVDSEAPVIEPPPPVALASSAGGGRGQGPRRGGPPGPGRGQGRSERAPQAGPADGAGEETPDSGDGAATPGEERPADRSEPAGGSEPVSQ